MRRDFGVEFLSHKISNGYGKRSRNCTTVEGNSVSMIAITRATSKTIQPTMQGGRRLVKHMNKQVVAVFGLTAGKHDYTPHAWGPHAQPTQYRGSAFRISEYFPTRLLLSVQLFSRKFYCSADSRSQNCRKIFRNSKRRTSLPSEQGFTSLKNPQLDAPCQCALRYSPL